MDLNLLQEIVSLGESNSLEFKESTTTIESAIKTLSAYLNTTGGRVIIGVRDNGKIIGQHVSDETEKEISRKLLKIEPRTHEITVKYIDLKNNKKIIVLEAPEGRQKPYLCEGRAFYRDRKETKQMPKDLYDHLVLKHSAMKIAWEDLPAQGGYTIKDLDEELIYKLVNRGIRARRLSEELAKESIEKLLERFDLLVDGSLKQAAVVLFAKKTFPTYPQCGTTMARFLGNDRTYDMLDNKHFYGNIFDIISEAENFVARNTAISSHFPRGQMQREDRPQVPVYAMREALVNAVCHLDYSQRDCSIMLQIFNDRLELWNAGTLMAPLNIDNLKTSHQSKRRNRHLGEILYKFDYFEGNATGIEKILRECKEGGYPEPIYKEKVGGVDVIFSFPSVESLTSIPSTKKHLEELTPRQSAILNMLNESAKTSTEINDKLGGTLTIRAIQRELTKLEQLGLIRRTGEKRSTIWQLK
jgi:ATP-dependent DNA helicase RecG